jgi:hypothetical protein
MDSWATEVTPTLPSTWELKVQPLALLPRPRELHFMHFFLVLLVLFLDIESCFSWGH